MIRVLHMIGCLEMGGSQNFVMNVYRRIDRTKIQFDFIIDKREPDFFSEEIKSLGGNIYYLPKFNGKNLFMVKKAWNGFFDEHREYKILHSHVRSYASLYLPVAKKHGLKTIIHSHSTSNGKGLQAMGKAILQYPLRYQADFFFACSRQAGKWLFGKKIAESSRFFHIKNAIDTERFAYNADKRASARAEFNISGDTFVLGYLGRLEEAKNPKFAIDVFNSFKKINPNSRLLMVGGGSLTESLEIHAEKLGVINDIIFTGARKDGYRLYSAMDYYIFPSVWEGLGISLIEAQSAGLKSICSENIQKEAILTDLVTVKNLSDGAEAWAEEIINTQKAERQTTIPHEITENGYDIKELTQWLTEFYLNK